MKGFLPAALALVTARILASVVFPQFDDSFITMRYAQNLAAGNGFVFNPGQWVLGESCPLFGLIESVFFLLHLPIYPSILALNILADVGSLYLVMRLLTRLELRAAGSVIVLLAIASPVLARICVGCMEANLFFFASLLTIDLFVYGRRGLAIAIASIAYFLRPEAVVLVALLLLWSWKQDGFMRALKLGALSLAVVALPLIAIYRTYGNFIPQSVIAKADWHPEHWWQTPQKLLLGDPLMYLLLPLAIYGAIIVWKQDERLRLLIIATLLLLALYMARRVLIMTWYSEPTSFAVILFAAIGIAAALSRSEALCRVAAGQRGVWLACAVGVLIWGGMFAKQGRSRVTTNVYGGIEQWFAVHPAQGKTIIAHDIGAVGYFSRAEIFDLDGLVWPEAKDYASTQEAARKLRPDFIFETNAHSALAVASDSIVGADYFLIATFSQDKGAAMDSLHRDVMEWNQNYLLYSRKH